MKTEQPLVSVVMNCYNGEKYLREAIDSVYQQTYKNWEIVFWDNASTDNSAIIAKTYDEHLRYFRGNETVPLSVARNKALQKARGEFIALLDCDDIWLPEKLEIQSMHIQKNPNAKLFFANTIHFNDEGVEIRRQYDRFNPCKLNLSKGKALNNLLIHGCFIDTESVVFNKEAALSIGGFDTEYKYVVDADFFKRMGSKYDMYAGKETLAKWRVHTNQSTQSIGDIMFKEGKQMFSKYFWYNGVTNMARFSMIFYLLRSYIKQFLIKKKLLKNNIGG